MLPMQYNDLILSSKTATASIQGTVAIKSRMTCTDVNPQW